MFIKSGQSVSIDFRTENIDGQLTDATGTPSVSIFRNGVGVLSGTVSKPSSTTGLYVAAFTAGSWDEFDQISLEATAVVDGITYKRTVWRGTVINALERDGGLLSIAAARATEAALQSRRE